MSVRTTLKIRRSTRGFLPTPVSRELLSSIFRDATGAPSNCNVQPWNCYVVTGQALEKLRGDLYDLAGSGAPPDPDFEFMHGYRGKHRERQVDAARALYGSLSIERDDMESRHQALLRNWRFFDAPHVVFFTMEKYLGLMGAVDLGIFAQSVALLMAENGIGSCMQGALNQYTSLIRVICQIPDSHGIVFGMSFGYADPDARINLTRTGRDSFDHLITIVD